MFVHATVPQEDIRTGETEEEALQRRIEEGKIGKGKTLRRWKDTEEKVHTLLAIAVRSCELGRQMLFWYQP